MPFQNNWRNHILLCRLSTHQIFHSVLKTPSGHRDPKIQEPSKRNTFNGLALAVIQSDNQTGVVRVRTNSSSLKNTSIEIVTRKPANRIATVGQ
jgi:hypothetical protein